LSFRNVYLQAFYPVANFQLATQPASPRIPLLRGDLEHFLFFVTDAWQLLDVFIMDINVAGSAHCLSTTFPNDSRNVIF
jgi:hypothetical protein